MPHTPRKKVKRLRYPEDPLKQAAVHALPNDATRGKTIPNKLADPEVRGMLIIAAAFTTVEIAAAMAGVAPSSVYELRRRDPAFEERWQTAKARAVASVELAYYRNAVIKMNVEAQKGFLAAHKPEVYRPRSEVDVSVGDVPTMIRQSAERARERKRLLIESKAAIVDVHGYVNGNGNGHVNGNGSEPE